MAAEMNSLDQIKSDLESCIGKRIRLKANRGRKKIIEAEGVLESTYPKLFVIKLDQVNAVERMSYTYADVLTQTVELTIDDHRVGAAT